MTGDQWIEIHEVQGMLQAELLRGLLEAQGVPVWLSQEGAGRAMGLTIGSLGMVHILVPEASRQQALEILEEFHMGDYADRNAEAGSNRDDEEFDEAG